MIYDIIQDSDGYLWFATKDGLNRYDGYRFEIFTNNPFDPFSIAGNDIHGMFEDSGAIFGSPSGAETWTCWNGLPASFCT